MAFRDTPLGQRLVESLEAAVPDDIEMVVYEVAAKVWTDSLDAATIVEAMKLLQGHRRFEHVISIAEAGVAVGLLDATGRRLYCQSLIETGVFHAAELVAEALVASLPNGVERGEALGLLGRLRKERYLAGGRPDDLVRTIESYREGYALGTDPCWHGANLIALARRSERDGVPLADGIDVTALTSTILGLARAKEADLRSIWERATEIECLLASDDSATEAVTVAESLATAGNVSQFELQSLRRQLMEVWQLPPQHPVLIAIADRQLQLGAGAEVQLPETPLQLEKIFGTALPVGYNHLLRGLACAESVCKITDASGEPWGTGFLVAGSLIHPDLGEAPILITNAHVVSPEPGVGKLVPEDARAAFDVTKSTDGAPLTIEVFESLWTSPPSKCDVTLLRFSGADAAIKAPIEVAKVPAPVTEGAYVYVIGHPAGGGIKFSIRGNDLLAYDEGQIKVHYTAPTEGGSSGSPVFNSAWQLMAVHHAGDSKMHRLDDAAATYQANEGITITAIRKEYEQR